MMRMPGLVVLMAISCSGLRPEEAPDPRAPTRFVALARERGEVERRDWSDMRIGLWEIDPGKTTAVRRHDLGHSPWLPTPLVDAPEFLRWQVPPGAPAGGGPYRVHLLHLDHATLDVAEVGVLDQAHGIARCGDRIYLQTSAGPRVLDRRSKKLTVQDPGFDLLAEHGEEWLVAVDGCAARLDARTGRVVRRYPEISVADEVWAIGTRWGGGRFALQGGDFVDEHGGAIEPPDYAEFEVQHLELHLWDLERGQARVVRPRVRVAGGSGIATLLHTNLDPRWVGETRLHYQELREGGGDDPLLDTECVVIDLVTGEEVERMTSVDCSESSHGPSAPEFEVQEELRELFAASPIGVWGEAQDLAWAFLTHHGVTFTLDLEGVCKFDAVGAARDGQELLVLHDGLFHHSDIENGVLTTWKAPAGLDTFPVELYPLESPHD